MSVHIATALLLISVLLLLLRSRYYRSKLPFPPGPKPLPFIGNALQMASFVRHKDAAEWRSYGDLVYMQALGRELVILNSAAAALDLLDKRGSVYSNRPRLVMARDLIGRSKYILVMHYNENFKATKKTLWNVLNPRAIQQYSSLQEAASVAFLKALVETPQDFRTHIHHNIAALALRIAYGYTALDRNDYFVALAKRFSRITSEAVEPGKWLVDSFPWMQYIPHWIPGAQFKRWAQASRLVVEEFANAPYELVKSRMADGTAMPSFTSRAIESAEGANRGHLTPHDDDFIKHAAASLYSGSTGTTSALLASFFLAMICNPLVLKKAQSEIDEVIGPARLPELSDEKRLPYVCSLIKELHRLYPPAPLTPHSPYEEDVYHGFRIPKGSSVVANTWAIFHDPGTYPNPEQFNPDRYMHQISGEPQMDPTEFSFGLGRRRCPGLHLANATSFLFIARIIAVFDILRPLNQSGREYIPVAGSTTGLVSEPESFECIIRPRSPHCLSLITYMTA